ncbi:HNH endonuclease [Nocardia sp. NBC_01009]|uniref:HNH endonuclease n=1 Tax=Nocardia sp. NBC_01009 TaxID=2975996 RepID=UPI00386DD38B|nr:HNH endonuclease [Nocardia sp. NBC_01009]
MQAWAFKSVGEERSWQSNDGYADVLGSVYVYDSGVGNHLMVTVGDMIVVYGREVVHGVSLIDHIDSLPGRKLRRMCPNCGRTSIDRRVTKRPMYLCGKCRSEFDVPEERQEPVILYTASYGTHWQLIDGALTTDDLETAVKTRDRQSAIRRCDLGELSKLLDRIHARVPKHTCEWAATPAGGHRVRTVAVRINQDKFRRVLLRHYGLRCAITGDNPAETLEAAHLRKFADHKSHDPRQGLLLRADIHKMFDSGRMAVSPDTMRLVVAPALASYLHYDQLRDTEVKAELDCDAVREHYTWATASW